jgi:hypothetical protein
VKILVTYGYDTETGEFFSPFGIEDVRHRPGTGELAVASADGTVWTVSIASGRCTRIKNDQFPVRTLAQIAGKFTPAVVASLIEAEQAEQN